MDARATLTFPASLGPAPIAAFDLAPNVEWCLNRIRGAVLPPAGRPAATAPERARDRELLTRVARGEVAALRTLYDEHAPRALAVATRILRSAPDAEDVVQETFLEIW